MGSNVYKNEYGIHHELDCAKEIYDWISEIIPQIEKIVLDGFDRHFTLPEIFYAIATACDKAALFKIVSEKCSYKGE